MAPQYVLESNTMWRGRRHCAGSEEWASLRREASAAELFEVTGLAIV